MNLAKTGYIVSDATLVELARNYAEGINTIDSIRGDSLKILVAHSKRELGKWKVKRATTEKALEAVNEAYSHLYAVVLEAITTPDLLPDPNVSQQERSKRAELRNRRSNFMRSAKSTLVAWINAGGRLSTLDPADVTKEKLRELSAPEGAAEDVDAVEDRIDTVETRLEGFVKELAAEDLDAARMKVEEIITRLRALVRRAEPPPGKMRQVTTRKKRVGEITLHPHH